MWSQIRHATIFLLILSFITGIIYPLVVTGLVQLAFPSQANGSLIKEDGQVVGSALIGQGFSGPKYFWSRPSTVGYNPMPSAGSNLSPTSQQLAEQFQTREQAIRLANGLPVNANLPADLALASGSGLDPHISMEAARLQINRVAQVRGLPKDRVAALVQQYTEPRQYGLLGEPRVNVLLLNIALDRLQ